MALQKAPHPVLAAARWEGVSVQLSAVAALLIRS